MITTTTATTDKRSDTMDEYNSDYDSVNNSDGDAADCSESIYALDEQTELTARDMLAKSTTLIVMDLIIEQGAGGVQQSRSDHQQATSDNRKLLRSVPRVVISQVCLLAPVVLTHNKSSSNIGIDNICCNRLFCYYTHGDTTLTARCVVCVAERSVDRRSILREA